MIAFLFNSACNENFHITNSENLNACRNYEPDDLTLDLNVLLNENISLSNSGGIGTFGETTVTNGLYGYTFDDIAGGLTNYRITEWVGDNSTSIGHFLRFGIAANDLGLSFFNDTSDVCLVGNGGQRVCHDFNNGGLFDSIPTDWNEVFDFDLELIHNNFSGNEVNFNSIMSSIEYIDIRAEIWIGLSGIETGIVPADSTFTGGSPPSCP